VVSQFSYLFAFDDVVLSFDINFIGTGQFLVEFVDVDIFGWVVAP
jgi:hypothetical protein